MKTLLLLLAILLKVESKCFSNESRIIANELGTCNDLSLSANGDTNGIVTINNQTLLFSVVGKTINFPRTLDFDYSGDVLLYPDVAFLYTMNQNRTLNLSVLDTQTFTRKELFPVQRAGPIVTNSDYSMVFVCGGFTYLDVYDLRDTSNPVNITRITTSGSVGTIYLTKDEQYLYVGSNYGGDVYLTSNMSLMHSISVNNDQITSFFELGSNLYYVTNSRVNLYSNFTTKSGVDFPFQIRGAPRLDLRSGIKIISTSINTKSAVILESSSYLSPWKVTGSVRIGNSADFQYLPGLNYLLTCNTNSFNLLDMQIGTRNVSGVIGSYPSNLASLTLPKSDYFLGYVSMVMAKNRTFLFAESGNYYRLFSINQSTYETTLINECTNSGSKTSFMVLSPREDYVITVDAPAYSSFILTKIYLPAFRAGICNSTSYSVITTLQYVQDLYMDRFHPDIAWVSLQAGVTAYNFTTRGNTNYPANDFLKSIVLTNHYVIIVSDPGNKDVLTMEAYPYDGDTYEAPGSITDSPPVWNDTYQIPPNYSRLQFIFDDKQDVLYLSTRNNSDSQAIIYSWDMSSATNITLLKTLKMAQFIEVQSSGADWLAVQYYTSNYDTTIGYLQLEKNATSVTNTRGFVNTIGGNVDPYNKDSWLTFCDIRKQLVTMIATNVGLEFYTCDGADEGYCNPKPLGEEETTSIVTSDSTSGATGSITNTPGSTQSTSGSTQSTSGSTSGTSSTTGDSPLEVQSPSKNNNGMIIGVSIAAAVVVIAIIVGIIIFIIIRRRRNNNNSDQNQYSSPEADISLNGSRGRQEGRGTEMSDMSSIIVTTTDDGYSNPQAMMTRSDSALFSVDDVVKRRAMQQFLSIKQLDGIKIQHKIGNGKFGEVYIADWCGASVAAKKLKDKQDILSFQKEANIMQKCSHPNIVQFHGRYLDDQKFQYIIVEYMSKGSLQYVLTRDVKDIKSDDQLDMMIGVCKGMIYLSNQNILHKDLGVRNILCSSVNGKWITKVSDFGLASMVGEAEPAIGQIVEESKDKFADNVYISNQSAIIPVRWSSPEVISKREFSIKSDVWAYGVLCWEILSYAQNPYAEYTMQQVADMVKTGTILTKPLLCPDDLWVVIRQCFEFLPDNRPNFTQLLESLQALLKQRDGKGESDHRHSAMKDDFYI